MHGTVYLLHLEPGLPVTGNRVARRRGPLLLTGGSS